MDHHHRNPASVAPDTAPASPTAPASHRGGVAVRLGFWAAVLTVVVTATFAALAVLTPPRSGPFCTSGCVGFPYVDVARFIPGDYLWLVPGLLLAPIFVVLMACIHAVATEPRRSFSRIGLAFAAIYAAIILVDYALQLAVVVPSLQAGETGSLPLFTQYNPHGLFIALEVLGYSMMTLAFLVTAPVFAGAPAERVVRLLFVLSFVLAVAAFAGLVLLQRDLVAFEVTLLMINWLVLLSSGTVLSVLFRRARRQSLRTDITLTTATPASSLASRSTTAVITQS